MRRDNRIKKITIVSLSKGILGENFIRHELDLGLKRLDELGIEVGFSKHALSGEKFISEHPESRAQDLLEAFKDDSDMILCAIGGDDTYRLLPYLFEHDELKKAVKEKVFLGFSDSTVNHFMLHKVGLRTFYGQAFLSDVCELDRDMLPYTKRCFEELIRTGTIAEIVPSDVWYESREDFSPAAVGSPTPSHPNEGFLLLQGPEEFEGPILGGCIDTIYDFFNNDRYEDSVRVCQKYGLFPEPDDWKGKILLLETSEERPTPEKFKNMVTALKEQGIFSVVSGVLFGKPADEWYFEAYQRILREVIDNPNLPVVVNVNVGHALPRCIVPFGVRARVRVREQRITFLQD